MGVTGKNRALVVGGGPAGMQAALVLAERGHRVALVEAAPAVGGLFPLLDNQFPTQSCGVCFMACDTPTYCPFVQCELHENVELLPASTVTAAERDGTDWRVRVSTRPTGVDRDKCTDCGACEAVCPVETAREFGDGLERRKAIHRCYPKAVGKGYAVDFETCTRCGKCVEACDAGAVDLDRPGGERWIEAGAVVLAPGAALYDAKKKGEFGFGRYENVLSAAKFERMLAADSPSLGRPVRLSDGKEPASIGFIQCVGSRDPVAGRDHCSSVCCMFSMKQALFAKERLPGAEVTIYFMDLRAFGKDYERYLTAAREAGIRLVRAMPSVIRQDPATAALEVAVAGEGTGLVRAVHDLVVLAAGFEQDAKSRELAALFGIPCGLNGFEGEDEFTPCETGLPGLFVCGSFRGAKDIPESVREGAAAAALAARVLEGGGAEEAMPGAPLPADFRDEAVRVGVVLCACEGYNTARLDFVELASRVEALPGVDFVATVGHGCSKAGMDEVRKLFAEKEPNRLVLAACTHRIVERLYRHMFGQMGVHAGILEWSDLREAAQAGGLDAAAQSIARAVASSAQAGFAPRQRVGLDRSVLVVGGGAAGMRAALDLAGLGHPVHLVERERELGGNLRTAAFTLRGNDPRALAASLEKELRANPNVHVHTSARVKGSEGRLGAFRTTVETEKGPVEILHGGAVLATGASEAKPIREGYGYGYGKSPRVLTQRELEAKLDRGEFPGGRVVMIQCVESRDEGRPYCSRVCCTHAVKNALRIVRDRPDAEVLVLHRDLRTYGNFEKSYRAAREAGVLFTAFDPAAGPTSEPGADKVRVSYREPAVGATVTVDADWLVLSVGMKPDVAENRRLAALFGVETDAWGFFKEKNPKAATCDFVRPGLYLAGLAHAPKHIEESLVQASAAAGRAAAVLARSEASTADNVSYVMDKLCSRCGLCVTTCPYGARSLDAERNVAVVDALLCKGCGACVALCPNKAARQYGAAPNQILAGLDELF